MSEDHLGDMAEASEEETVSDRLVRVLTELEMFVQDDSHKPYMQRAIQLAKKSQPDDSGPYVGAVIVKGDEIIAEAYKIREPWRDGRVIGRCSLHLCHAEEKAIEIAGNDAKGSTMYITLEPCTVRNIQGRRRVSDTPCVELITQAGISKVVMGRLDWENPFILGQGCLYLIDCGVQVELYNKSLGKKLEKLVELGELRRQSKFQEYLAKKIEHGKETGYLTRMNKITKVEGGKKRESNRLRKIIQKGINEYEEMKNDNGSN